jgi:hypothetical protein
MLIGLGWGWGFHIGLLFVAVNHVIGQHVLVAFLVSHQSQLHPESLSLSYLALFSEPCKQLASQKVKKETV